MAAVIVQSTEAVGEGGLAWRIDAAAVTEAVDFLGISVPVVVKLSSGRKRVGGCRKDGRGYVITVSRFKGALRASEILWHELTHAFQAERDAEGDWTTYVKRYKIMGGVSGRGILYKLNRYEREANEVAEAYASDYPLTREV